MIAVIVAADRSSAFRECMAWAEAFNVLAAIGYARDQSVGANTPARRHPRHPREAHRGGHPMTRDLVVSAVFLVAWVCWPWIEESVYVAAYVIWGEE